MAVNARERWIDSGNDYPIPGWMAPAPVLTVTADDTLKAVGEDDPAFTVQAAGFVGGDDVSVLGGTLTITREPGETVGTYVIIPSGWTSDHYDIRYVNGALTIMQMVGDPMAPPPAPPVVEQRVMSRGNELSLTWEAEEGVTYVGQYRDLLPGSEWQDVNALVEIDHDTEVASLSFLINGEKQRFYRIKATRAISLP